jgi:ATP-binding cassette subfamily B protein/subfamily B ATP-binding cassette protein MsbA
MAAPGATRLLAWVWRDHLRPRRWLLALAVLLMAVEGGAMGALSSLVRPMFDLIRPGGSMTSVILVAASVAGVFAVRALAGFSHRVIMARMAERVSAELQEKLLAHALTLDLAFHHDHAPGQMIERLRGDNQQLRALWPPIVVALGRDTVALASLLAVALWTDWRWTLIAVVGVPILAWPLTRLQGLVRKTARAARAQAAILSVRLDESFHGLQTLKLTGTERQEVGRYHSALATYLASQFRSETAAAAIPALIDLVAALGFAGVMLYGGAQIIAGEKTLGEFMAFFTAMALVFEPLRRLGSVSGGWAQARASLERMRAVLDEVPRITQPARALPLPRAPNGLRLALEDVHFGYGAVPVLRGVSFTAEPGQVTALVGPSGAGKSTIFHLLTRLVDPASGRVALNGTDLRGLDLAALRGAMAVVSQDSALFDETIDWNLRLGASAPTDAALTRALAEARAEFVDALPLGRQTPVGPRGSALSGGQRQRIAIARAILRDAPILLLDEATSALDAQSEAVVTEAMTRLARGRTTLVIAHRLSTVRAADKIVVMDQGRVVEQGRHEDLLAQGGLYAELHRLQMRG